MSFSGRRGRFRIDCLDRCDEAVTPFGQGFDKTRVLGVVAQGFAELIHGDSQAVVEINGRVRAPKPLLQSLAGNYLAWLLQQGRQQLEGLALQAD